VAIERVGVIGAGLMGGGIAQVCADHGLQVGIVDAVPGGAERAVQTIRRRLGREVQRGRITADTASRAVERIDTYASALDVASFELVIEAIIEDLGKKRTLFKQLGEAAGPATILASNTSSLPLSELAAASGRPEQVIGLHFFNPPYALRLVEVVPSESTSQETLKAALAFCDYIGRVTVRVKDAPGFIVNRLLVPYIFDSIHLVESGIGSSLDVDQACTSGLGHSMGPLATADLIGLDTLLFISEAMFEEFGEPRFKAPTSLRRLVSLGHLGRKTGKGYFDYPPAPAAKVGGD
jgi:3-hydroxybutyryl-CoA dehydrogenase